MIELLVPDDWFDRMRALSQFVRSGSFDSLAFWNGFCLIAFCSCVELTGVTEIFDIIDEIEGKAVPTSLRDDLYRGIGIIDSTKHVNIGGRAWGHQPRWYR